jgi:uncharacterized protein YbaR (Trm112 family)
MKSETEMLACPVCKGHGSVYTGYSGGEADGNAPETEKGMELYL